MKFAKTYGAGLDHGQPGWIKGTESLQQRMESDYLGSEFGVNCFHGEK